MRYLYYPGCSLKGTGRPYEESLLALLGRLGLNVHELPAWNCCGATAYMSVDEKAAFALAARNLALAEQQEGQGPACLVAPCNACYLVLCKTQRRLAEYPEQIGRPVLEALRAAGLDYRGSVTVRHPLDVLLNDVGAQTLTDRMTQSLNGLKVACYYGCQLVRPYATFDDQYNPTSMDTLLRAVGAEPIDWPLKARCCGGTLTGTIEEAGLRLSYILLKEARRRGAQIIATACPLCQFNLECYQDRMRAAYDDPISIPIVYFSQLLGRAMGIGDEQLGLHRMLVRVEPPLQPA